MIKGFLSNQYANNFVHKPDQGVSKQYAITGVHKPDQVVSN